VKRWVTLFIVVVSLIAILATGWNFVLVRDYEQIPWALLILGSLGFAGSLCGLILLFIKLVREMRLNQLQSEFVATVSHELKTPIATLELSSTLLRDETAECELSPEERTRLWASHEQELRRLREQVEALLEAARWQSGPVPISKDPQPLERWLDRSWSRWQSALGPGAKLERRGDSLPGSALLDLRLMNLITDNLLDNARKFARSTPSVVVESRLIPPTRAWSKPKWQIEIRDEGWGFQPEDSNRIFQRFFRAKTQAPYAIPGTGLGLYLASSASRALGLTLRGYSDGVGKGASFTITGTMSSGGLSL
jgi:signal transduction histidine kinase